MKTISPIELKQRLDKGENLNIIDVREEWEHEEFNIGGTLIPMASLPEKLTDIQNLKSEEVIVYCKSGNRSGRALQFLESNGFTNVINLSGGMMEWQKQFT